MNESNPNLVDHTVVGTPEFTDGEIAYRRRQARGALSWRERLLLFAGGALVLFFAANGLWALIK